MRGLSRPRAPVVATPRLEHRAGRGVRSAPRASPREHRHRAIGGGRGGRGPSATHKGSLRSARSQPQRRPSSSLHPAEFLERYARHWKLRTLESSAYMVRNHILPAFGHLTVDAIAVKHVRDWFESMADKPGSANRAMPTLSVMMRMAELWGYRPHNSNPCKNTRRYKMKPMERFLTAEEMARLNAVLTRDEFWCPHIVAIVRLLMLTGCRFGEIAALEWDWIKDRRIHLPDSKSGPRTVWLSSAARAVIDAIPRYSPDCPYLFPARPPTRPIDTIQRQWDRIRDEAGLPGLRLHDLRHSWASTAAMNGVDMVTIAKLLGHALVETTERYVHLSDRSVADAADRVSNRIHAALAGREEGGGRASRATRPAQAGSEAQPEGAFRHVHI